MKNLSTSGRYLFAIAIIGIGLVHVATGNFPVSLLPFPAFAGKKILVYGIGLVFILGGISLFVDRLAKPGASVVGATFLLLFLFPHLPKLFSDVSNPGEWTVASETLALCCGTFITIPLLTDAGNLTMKSNKLLTGMVKLAPYVFALTLVVFAVQHYLYADFIAKIVPAWMPARLFLAYLVMCVFMLTAISIILNYKKHEIALIFGCMFLIMFAVLHVPRVVNNFQTETEWTSMFIALAMSGIGFIMSWVPKNIVDGIRPANSFG